MDAVMAFGSTSADSGVFFESNINLGVPLGGNQGANALYSRVISVTANANDNLNAEPNNLPDFAEFDGIISSTNSYTGLSKTGTGAFVPGRGQHLHGSDDDRTGHAGGVRRQRPGHGADGGVCAQHHAWIDGGGADAWSPGNQRRGGL